jgi:hypothetical protein
MLGIDPITAYCVLHGYAKLAPGAWVAQTGASSATAGYVLALAKHAGLRTLKVVQRPESVGPLLDAGARSYSKAAWAGDRQFEPNPASPRGSRNPSKTSSAALIRLAPIRGG